MRISPQRIEDVIRAFESLRRDLETLHAQGQRANECDGWPECDCRLAEQIRGITHIEEGWKTRKHWMVTEDGKEPTSNG